MELTLIVSTLEALVQVFDPKDANKVFQLSTVVDELKALIDSISQDKTVWPAVVKLYEDARTKSGI